MAISRREFTRAGLATALAASGRALPAFGQAVPGAGSSQRKVGFCVIGLGEIAKHFIGGVKGSEHCAITGLVSGDRAKAERTAAAIGVPAASIYSYADMERMRENKAIDAVYVALPNGMHAEYTARSARAGKHVLCEKPMAVSVAECDSMIAACKEAGVKLMIAYRMQYEPLTLEAIQRLRSGEIGDIQGIESAFGFNIQPHVWRLEKKMSGGGPLLDVGIYCLNATRYITGEEPVEFKAMATTRTEDGRFREVEETVGWTTRFPSGILAVCNTTYAGDMPGYVKVTGSKGVLELAPAFAYEGIAMTIHAGKGEPERKTNPEKDPTQFGREADAFARNILDGTPVKASGEMGLADLRFMREVYRSAGIAG